jgi:putative transport protein
MHEAAALLHRYPELALFLTILLGVLIGRLHIEAFGLGSVVGSLLVGIVVGIFAKPEFPPLLRWSFFYLFLFAIGYSVGPRFFGGLRKQAIPQIVMAVILASTGVLTTVAVAYAFGFDEGVSVGLFSGSLTQSAALGTGLNAIANLPIPDDIKAQLSANAPVGDAITYGFGDLWLILLITAIGPTLMRANLKAEAKLLESQLTGGAEPGGTLLGHGFGVRGYRVENAAVCIGVNELEDRYAAGRLSVQRLTRDGAPLSITPTTRIQLGDQIVVAAQRSVLLNAEREIGPEFDDAEIISVPMETITAVVTSSSVVGRTLGSVASDRQFARGVYLESLHRGEQEIPRELGVSLQRGDVLKLVGSATDLARAAKWLGYIEADITKTDIAFVAGGIACGILLGLLNVKINGMPFGLGTAGSILVVGLLAGWARSHYPVFGAVPEASQRVLADIGLTVFIAIVGLTAGPHAVDAYIQRGGSFFASIFFGGMIVTIIPSLAALITGRWIFRMNPLMVLAGVTGAQTCMAALNALRESSDSDIGALGYTVPYAIGNILLTMSGPVVVGVIHALRT